jgi:electron transfer flavoprotein alpha subunit
VTACNEVWVVAETRPEGLTRATRQLLGAARHLAGQRKFRSAAVLPGGRHSDADELARLTELVLWLNEPQLDPYEATQWVEALRQLVEMRGRPAAILAAASAAGLESMPRLAAALATGYASSCTALWWEDSQLAARRPIYGGKVYEELAFVEAPALVTVRPGAFPECERLPEPGEQVIVPVSLPEAAGVSTLERRVIASGKQILTEAVIVVAGGRGVGEPGTFRLVEDLSQVLGGAVGASRALVDGGQRPHDEQVGKSGKTISPELYIACGISGAIHHVLGMNTSKVVVAINTDPEAPIFLNADYGVVADARQLLPALTEALRRSKGGS